MMAGQPNFAEMRSSSKTPEEDQQQRSSLLMEEKDDSTTLKPRNLLTILVEELPSELDSSDTDFTPVSSPVLVCEDFVAPSPQSGPSSLVRHHERQTEIPQPEHHEERAKGPKEEGDEDNHHERQTEIPQPEHHEERVKEPEEEGGEEEELCDDEEEEECQPDDKQEDSNYSYEFEDEESSTDEEGQEVTTWKQFYKDGKPTTFQDTLLIKFCQHLQNILGGCKKERHAINAAQDMYRVWDTINVNDDSLSSLLNNGSVNIWNLWAKPLLDKKKVHPGNIKAGLTSITNQMDNNVQDFPSIDDQT